MNSNDDREHEREHDNAVHWSVFAPRGGQYGPILVTTDRTVLRATAAILGAIAVWGFAIWLTLSVPLFNGSIQWVAVGVFAVFGVFNIHTVVIEVYSAGVRTAIEQQSLGEGEVDERR
jgi:hypothetical protein